MRSGGMSVLITSATDALAFMVGSMTVLPALSWFCMFAGLGVAICFFLQIFFFLPLLALDARRAESGRLDCCCCFRVAQKRTQDEPQGCCACCGSCCACDCCKKPDKLSHFFEHTFGDFVTSTAGIVATLAAFTGVLVVGIVGMCNIYRDFKLEWFIPDDSYVQDFFDLNDSYFKNGQSLYVYHLRVIST
jgi:predicted RND superfamily exporter protein